MNCPCDPFPRRSWSWRCSATEPADILPLFLWGRSHAGWICDSLHKHLRGRFLASLSHVFKSGLHHPSKYLKKKKKEDLSKPNDCFARPGQGVSLFGGHYGRVCPSRESTPWGRCPSYLPGAWFTERMTTFQMVWKCVIKSRNVRLFYLFCVYVVSSSGPAAFLRAPSLPKKPSSLGICILSLWEIVAENYRVGLGRWPSQESACLASRKTWVQPPWPTFF